MNTVPILLKRFEAIVSIKQEDGMLTQIYFLCQHPAPEGNLPLMSTWLNNQAASNNKRPYYLLLPGT